METPRLQVSVPSDTSHPDLCYYGVGLDGSPWPVWASVQNRPFVRIRPSATEVLRFDGRGPALRVVWLDASGQLAAGEISPRATFQKVQAMTFNASTNITSDGNALVTEVQGPQLVVNMGEAHDSVHKMQEFDLGSIRRELLSRTAAGPNNAFDGEAEVRVCVSTERETVVGRVHRDQMTRPEAGADWPLGFGPRELSLPHVHEESGRLTEAAWHAARQWMRRQVLTLRYDPGAEALTHEAFPDQEAGSQVRFEPSGTGATLTVSFGSVSERISLTRRSGEGWVGRDPVKFHWFWARQTAQISHDVQRYLVWIPQASMFLGVRGFEAAGRCDPFVSWRLAEGALTVYDHRAAPPEILNDVFASAS